MRVDGRKKEMKMIRTAVMAGRRLESLAVAGGE